jgi:hypothetical protein
MQRLNLEKHKPVKTIKMTLKFLFGLKKNIGGADVYSETLIAIARKSQDLEDLIMNLDERSLSCTRLSPGVAGICISRFQ